MPVFPPSAIPSTKSLQDLIHETLQYLNSSYHEAVNELASDLSGDQTTIKLTRTLAGIKPGVTISVGLEDMLVWAVTESTFTIDVKRAMRGSLPITHTVDEPVVVKPLYSHFSILRAINNDLADLSTHGLFQVKTTDLTWNPSIQGYDLPGVTDVSTILELRYQDSNLTSQRWPVIPSGNYEISRDMSDPFDSTLALFFTSGGISDSPIRVRYAAPFTPLTHLTADVLATSGLPASAQRLPPIGAAISLAGGQEIKRNVTENQGDTRRAAEVPAGARGNATRQLQILRQQWLIDEASALRKLYPFRQTTFASASRYRAY